jgi:hypothetical protein
MSRSYTPVPSSAFVVCSGTALALKLWIMRLVKHVTHMKGMRQGKGLAMFTLKFQRPRGIYIQLKWI